MYNKINEKPLKKVRFVDNKAVIYEDHESVAKEDVDDYIYKDQSQRHSER